MNLEIDPDLKAVAEFMQGSLPAARLVAVAQSVAAIAPILWGHYGGEPIQAMRLVAASSSACDPHKRSDTSE